MASGHSEYVPKFADDMARDAFRASMLDECRAIAKDRESRPTPVKAAIGRARELAAIKAFALRSGSASSGQGRLFGPKPPKPPGPHIVSARRFPFDPAKHPRGPGGRYRVVNGGKKFALSGEPARRKAAADVPAAKERTGYLFDMKRGDKRGQTTIMEDHGTFQVGHKRAEGRNTPERLAKAKGHAAERELIRMVQPDGTMSRGGDYIRKRLAAVSDEGLQRLRQLTLTEKDVRKRSGMGRWLGGEVNGEIRARENAKPAAAKPSVREQADAARKDRREGMTDKDIRKEAKFHRDLPAEARRAVASAKQYRRLPDSIKNYDNTNPPTVGIDEGRVALRNKKLTQGQREAIGRAMLYSAAKTRKRIQEYRTGSRPTP